MHNLEEQQPKLFRIDPSGYSSYIHGDYGFVGRLAWSDERWWWKSHSQPLSRMHAITENYNSVHFLIYIKTFQPLQWVQWAKYTSKVSKVCCNSNSLWTGCFGFGCMEVYKYHSTLHNNEGIELVDITRLFRNHCVWLRRDFPSR